MQTLTILLWIAGIALLILLAIAPCGGVDHYADQVVHAGVGNIAGPNVKIDMRPYAPPGENFIDNYPPDDDDMISGIVGKTS